MLMSKHAQTDEFQNQTKASIIDCREKHKEDLSSFWSKGECFSRNDCKGLRPDTKQGISFMMSLPGRRPDSAQTRPSPRWVVRSI